MKRNILTSTVCLILSFNSYSQKTKVGVIPKDAEIMLDGIIPLHPSLTPKQINSFMLATKKDYITQGRKAEDILKEGDVFNFKLTPVSKKPLQAKTKRIEFSKIVDGTGKLTKSTIGYGYYFEGFHFQDAKYANSFVKTMIEWGVNTLVPNAVFEEKTEIPHFALACEVMAFGKDTRGPGFQVSVLLDWSLYSVSQKKVVYKLVTGGFSDSRLAAGLENELILAINDGLVGLINDAKFQEIVSDKNTNNDLKPLSSTKLPKIPSVKYTGYGDMIKKRVGSAVTVKTNFGHGSGFLISEDGYILTNNHVIEGATSIEVIFESGITVQGTLTKANEERDVALVKISGKGFKPFEINTERDAAGVGTEVIAIGTPTDVNLGQTVTKGIISGKRELEDRDNKKRVYLQTDVSISLGNSGGPLINIDGQVVGVIVSKIMDKGAEGLGFAIPIEEALKALNINIE